MGQFFKDLGVEKNCRKNDVWNAQPHIVNFNILDSTCGVNCLEELSWRVNKIMPKIYVVYLTWCFSFLLVPWPCYSMCMYVCKCGFVTFLDVMLRTPLANERSTRVSAWISAMSLLPCIVATLQSNIIQLSLECVYVVNTKNWSQELERDIYQDP